MKRKQEFQFFTKQANVKTLQAIIDHSPFELIADNHFSYLTTESKIKYLANFLTSYESVLLQLKTDLLDLVDIKESIQVILENQVQFHAFKTKFLSKQNANNDFLISLFKELKHSKWFLFTSYHYKKIQDTTKKLLADELTEKKQKTIDDTRVLSTSSQATFRILQDHYLAKSDQSRLQLTSKYFHNENNTITAALSYCKETLVIDSRYFQKLFELISESKNRELNHLLKAELKIFINFLKYQNVNGNNLLEYSYIKNNTEALNIIYHKAKQVLGSDMLFSHFAIACNKLKEFEQYACNQAQHSPVFVCALFCDEASPLTHPPLTPSFKLLIQKGYLHLVQVIFGLMDNTSSYSQTHRLLNSVDEENRNALELAVFHQQKELVEFLLKYIPIFGKDGSLSKAIAIAAITRNLDIFKLLLNSLPLEQFDKVLLVSIFKNDLNAVLELLNTNQFNIDDVQAFCSIPPLVIAAACGHSKLIELLLQNVNHCESNLLLALIYATFNHRNEIVQILLNIGITPKLLLDSDNFQAADVAGIAITYNNIDGFQMIAQSIFANTSSSQQEIINKLDKLIKTSIRYSRLNMIVTLYKLLQRLDSNLAKTFEECVNRPHFINPYRSESYAYHLIKIAIGKHDTEFLQSFLTVYSNSNTQEQQSIIIHAAFEGSKKTLKILNKRFNLKLFEFQNAYTFDPEWFLFNNNMSFYKKINSKENHSFSLLEILYIRDYQDLILQLLKEINWSDLTQKTKQLYVGHLLHVYKHGLRLNITSQRQCLFNILLKLNDLHLIHIFFFDVFPSISNKLQEDFLNFICAQNLQTLFTRFSDTTSRSLLTEAVYRNNYEVTQLLINLGADYSFSDKNHFSAYELAKELQRDNILILFETPLSTTNMLQ